ncbi:sigma-70 family RNA polymerase sigma factor [Sphingomonas baiyangensis]|uniref:Sigma-70 family RNA polymerase sigma factor n=1 Tax=Sphingomonas baiyangensis TaxID=2572576 RepID=A0A4U1L2Y2_9SPHN|nr:sigma-70 family RNA polymerase sigma factor [Sphingomonas baiyangensis]TKD51251.1 sigma-70 family RNA polymerase sigma factor [Sphingomonas baiyangensis]
MQHADAARHELSDELARVGAGDCAAMKRVYDRTSGKLFGICLRVLHDREAAEDALQEVYLKVWHHARAFDRERASPITWMCAVARNTAIDWRRGSERGAVHAAALHDGTPQVGGDTDADILLRQCMDQLDERQHASIRSAFFDGYTYAELADRAAVPLATMKSWIRRGLERLRKCLDHG